jgi:hypothetical protein
MCLKSFMTKDGAVGNASILRGCMSMSSWDDAWDILCSTWRKTLEVDKDPAKSRRDPKVAQAMMDKYGRAENEILKLAYPQLTDAPNPHDLFTPDRKRIEGKADGKGGSTGNLFYEILSSGNMSSLLKENPEYIAYLIPCQKVGFLLDNNILRSVIECQFKMTIDAIVKKAKAREFTSYKKPPSPDECGYAYTSHNTFGILIPWRTQAGKVVITKHSCFIEELKPGLGWTKK